MKASVMKTSRCATTRTRSLMLALCCLLVGSTANGQERPMLSDQLVGREFTYIVQPGDSLTAIGARFGVGVNVLADSNKLAPNARLKIAQELNIDNRHIVPRAHRRRHRHQYCPSACSTCLRKAKRCALIRLRSANRIGRRRADASGSRSKRKIRFGRFPSRSRRKCGATAKKSRLACRRVPTIPWANIGSASASAATAFMARSRRRAFISFRPTAAFACTRTMSRELFPAVERGTPVLLLYRRLLVARIGDANLPRSPSRYLRQASRASSKSCGQLGESENLAARVDWRLADDIIRRQYGIAREITKGNTPGLDYEAVRPHLRDRLNRNSDAKTPDHSRRRFLRLGIVALAAASLPRQTFAASASGSRPSARWRSSTPTPANA